MYHQTQLELVHPQLALCVVCDRLAEGVVAAGTDYVPRFRVYREHPYAPEDPLATMF